MTRNRVISFISAPGGVGKTTVALCTSWFMKENNKSPLLIDLDPSIGLTLNLKYIKEYITDIDDKGRTSADLLEKVMEGEFNHDFDLNRFINISRFANVNLEFIASSMRMEDAMGKIWHTTTAGHSEKKLKEVLKIVPESYKHIIIDNIPCYGLTYALTTLFASDICIIPMRLTLNDLGRTIGMIKKLRETAKKYEMKKSEFEHMIYFLFNKVETQYNREKKIPSYKHELLEVFPEANFFENFIPDQVGFTRIGTEEQISTDINNVRKKFKPFYDEFKEKILK